LVQITLAIETMDHKSSQLLVVLLIDVIFVASHFAAYSLFCSLVSSGVLLKMEVGIRKGAWQRA